MNLWHALRRTVTRSWDSIRQSPRRFKATVKLARFYLPKSLAHHWRAHIALSLGAAIACAILTGALVVGESMNESLRQLAHERLGNFDVAITPNFPVRAELAAKTKSSPDYPEGAAPPVALLSRKGSAAIARDDGSRGQRVGRLRVFGVGGDFFSVGFKDAPGTDAESLPSAIEPDTAVVNQTLARELDARVGDDLLIAVRKRFGAPLGSFLGNRDDPVRTLRKRIAAVLPDRGPGLFALESSQSVPRLVYVSLTELQAETASEGLANVLLVDLPLAASEEETAAVKQSVGIALEGALQLSDLGLRRSFTVNVDVGGVPSFTTLESTRMVLSQNVVDTVDSIAEKHDLDVQPVLTHLAERLAVAGEPDRRVAYSTVAAFDLRATPPFGPMKLLDGKPAAALKPGEILINEWAAQDLSLDPSTAPDTKIDLTYYVARADESVTTASATFTLRGIVSMERLGADKGLTPEFPGITEEEIKNIGDWEAPFPLDTKLIRDRDEEYWDRYGAAPKAFLSASDGKRFFETRYGPATSLRISPPLESRLLLHSELPARLGLIWRDVRAEALEATTGGTGAEFGMLFVSMSFFLILSAAILVALLFGLQLDRRVREAGILLAEGFRIASVRRLLLAEAVLVAGIGGLVGVALALGYAALLLEALRTLWWDAVRVPFLVLHAPFVTVAIGYLSTCFVVFAAIIVMARRLKQVSVRSLLSGVPLSARSIGVAAKRPRKSLTVGLVTMIFAVGLALATRLSDAVPVVAGFFGVGMLTLVAGLAFLSVWLRRHGSIAERRPSLARLGMRNAKRAAGRSLLTASLVASATFIIIAVGASQQDPTTEAPRRDSGNGGFVLAATSDVPVAYRLDTEVGRDELGLEGVDVPVADGETRTVNWQGMQVYPFRVRPGDNASCLNLNAPRDPRILGASDEFIERGGFVFRSHLAENEEERANPWRLLERKYSDGAVPVIGDANSTQWILKKKLGDLIPVQNDAGETVMLRLVATLSGSIFQGELLMSRAALERQFPTIEGSRFFLVELPVESAVESAVDSAVAGAATRVHDVERGLELGLEDYGFDVVGTNALIASFLTIEHTYISIFQMLGGLGLLLGTFGLGIVLLRGVIERRGELALMRAIGFQRRALSTMVVAEDVLLLTFGIVIGAGAAGLGLVVRIGDASATVPWGFVAILLAVVFVSGLLSAVVAVGFAARAPLLPVLRAE